MGAAQKSRTLKALFILLSVFSKLGDTSTFCPKMMSVASSTRLCTKSPALRRFSLSHWERVGLRACDLYEEPYSVGSVYFVLLGVDLLVDASYKKSALPFVLALPSVPTQGKGTKHFL
jgi:hypothetical protein